MAVNLDNISLGYSPLSQQIFLFRHGKDRQLALDKREAEKDVIAVVIEMMMDDAPKGATKQYRFGDQWYELTVKPVFTPSSQART